MLPVTFGALDGEASWRAEEGAEVGPHRLAAAYPTETTRPALFTALRTGFAEALLREAFVAVRDLRARRRAGARPGRRARRALGLGKLLVVAPDQEHAQALPRDRPALDPGGAGAAGGAARHLGHAGRARGAGRVPAAAGAVDPGHGGDGL